MPRITAAMEKSDKPIFVAIVQETVTPMHVSLLCVTILLTYFIHLTLTSSTSHLLHIPHTYFIYLTLTSYTSHLLNVDISLNALVCDQLKV